MCNAQYITQLEYELLKDKPGINVVGENHLIFFDPNFLGGQGRNVLLSVRTSADLEIETETNLRFELFRTLIQDLKLGQGQEHGFQFEGRVPGLWDEHYVIKRLTLKDMEKKLEEIE